MPKPETDPNLPRFSYDLIKSYLPTIVAAKRPAEILKLSDRDLGFYLGQIALLDQLRVLVEEDNQEN